MARRWTKEEENKNRSELSHLYIKQNKSLGEVSKILGMPESTVFRRLRRLKIKTQPYLKRNFLKKRTDIKIPYKYSEDLAEFFGIMLGDGHVSHFQIVVSLGNKEEKYAQYVMLLIEKIFKTKVKISLRSNGHRDIYLGSVEITSWLLKQGLVHNKVKSQVNVPLWIFDENIFMERSFCNRSLPILKSLQEMLKKLKYNPSSVSLYNMYLTKRGDVKRFFEEIKPSNLKHVSRYLSIANNLRRSDSGYSRRL